MKKAAILGLILILLLGSFGQLLVRPNLCGETLMQSFVSVSSCTEMQNRFHGFITWSSFVETDKSGAIFLSFILILSGVIWLVVRRIRAR